MKQSWVVGIVTLYVIAQGLTMFVQTSSSGDSSIWGVMDGVFRYNMTQIQGTQGVSSIWVPAQIGISVFMSFFQIILMYYPALFSGVYVWFWYVVLFPISVGFVISIVSMIRGVSSA